MRAFVLLLLAIPPRGTSAGGETERQVAGFPPDSLPYRARFVGSERCGACHAEHFRQYQSHPMALTGRAVTPENFKLWFADERLKKPVAWPASPKVEAPRYRAASDGVVLDSGGRSVRVGAVLGSGARGFTPISAEPDRSIRELRLSFSAQNDTWLMTPGSERERDPLGTPDSAETSRECLECHGTLLAWRNDVVDFEESSLGVQCERCHGPGSAHVEAVQAGNPSSIFNPGDLRADQQVEFCGQCHRQPFDIDPVAAMSRHPSIARHAGAGLMLSACFRRSSRETTITCLDCHDPHREREEAARGACLRCHAAPEQDHRSQGIGSLADCVSCHMPVEEKSLMGVGFTDHWIGRPGSPAPVDSSEREEYLEYLEGSYRRGSERPRLGPEKNAQLGVGLAEIQFARQSRETAFRTLEAALSFSPSYTQRLRAAALYRQAGRLPEAVDVLGLAIAGEPERVEAYHEQGELFQQQGQLYDAAARYRRALEIDPDSAATHNSLGTVLGSQGRYEEALTHFETAVALDSSYPEPRSNMGLALQRMGRLDEARSQLERALAARPDWPVAQNALARILATHPDATRRNPKEAVRLADRAAELTGYEIPAILDTLAAAYASDGNFEKAVAVAEEAIRRAPEGPLAELLRSRLDLYREKRPYVEAPRD